jgi:hypothetical protein
MGFTAPGAIHKRVRISPSLQPIRRVQSEWTGVWVASALRCRLPGNRRGTVIHSAGFSTLAVAHQNANARRQKIDGADKTAAGSMMTDLHKRHARCNLSNVLHGVQPKSILVTRMQRHFTINTHNQPAFIQVHFCSCTCFFPFLTT